VVWVDSLWFVVLSLAPKFCHIWLYRYYGDLLKKWFILMSIRQYCVFGLEILAKATLVDVNYFVHWVYYQILGGTSCWVGRIIVRRGILDMCNFLKFRCFSPLILGRLH
jgi:hypothetical protein